MDHTEVAYLGPAHTFTHDAATALFGEEHHLVPLPNVYAVLDAVSKNTYPCGVVPIENSVQGEVTTTMDALVFDYKDIYVSGEYVLPVTFSAFRKPGDESSPTSVLSHPAALAQCRRYVERLGLKSRTTNSTAEACEIISLTDEPGLIAISSHTAGQFYNLRAIASGIEDYPGAATKFFSVSQNIPPRSGADKTLLVLNPLSHDSGVLSRSLSEFANRGLNLHTIHTRTLRAELGSYAFVITVAGHISDRPMQEALEHLLNSGISVKFAGSFASWQGILPNAPTAVIAGIATSTAVVPQWLRLIANRAKV